MPKRDRVVGGSTALGPVPARVEERLGVDRGEHGGKESQPGVKVRMPSAGRPNEFGNDNRNGESVRASG